MQARRRKRSPKSQRVAHIRKRQGKKISQCLWTMRLPVGRQQKGEEDTNNLVEEEMPTKALKDITNTTSPPINSADKL